MLGAQGSCNLREQLLGGRGLGLGHEGRRVDRLRVTEAC